MKRKMLVIICISIFAVTGIIAGIVNCTDSNADEEKSKATAPIEDMKVANDGKQTKNSNKQKTGADAVGNPLSKEKGVNKKKKGDFSSEVKDSSPNGAPSSKPTIKESSKPSHEHSWEAIYKTRQSPHIRQVPWTKCYCCGADMTGNPSHIDQHLLNGESNVHYGTEYRSETYYISEQYVSGYKCSCGAIK
ncbi:MAG: hypothetical protein GX663_02680 [Clostridiales bacterium]|nr:hypothetical protein [Clostridiales bacterium]